MIYFDANANTPLDPDVLELMHAVLEERLANPSAIHAAGRMARDRIEAAREQVARLLGARPHEIIFTGSGTEANNLALRAAFRLPVGQTRRIIAGWAPEQPIAFVPCSKNSCTSICRRTGCSVRRPVHSKGVWTRCSSF